MNYFINPVSLECHIKILDEMRKYICSIGINKEIITFGFFCKFPFPDNEHMLPALISNSQKINNEILAKEKEIFILINDEGNSPKYVNLEDKIKYVDEDYHITIIEINEDKDGIKNFFELDKNIWSQETNKIMKEPIYTLQNSNNKLYVSYGIISDIVRENDCNFVHMGNLKEKTIGSPILNLSNNKLIGIHIKTDEKMKSNIGLFLNFPIKEFIDKTYYKRMTVKEFAYKYNLELKNKKIEKMDLKNNNLGNEGFKRISELQYKELKGLKELYLSQNFISDVKPLENLNFEKLEILDLSDNKINDINVLSDVKFQELKYLNLGNNLIKEIDVFEKVYFQELEILILNNNKITDINILGKVNFKKIKELDLSGNNIYDLKCLEKVNFKYLEKLNLNSNNLKDLNQITKFDCNGLKELDLGKNRISEIKCLTKLNLENLEILVLDATNITSIDTLSKIGFKKLKKLSLKSNNISNISVLENLGLDLLEVLNLASNNISDINILEKVNIPGLKELNLSENKIADIKVLEKVKFPKLEILNLILPKYLILHTSPLVY